MLFYMLAADGVQEHIPREKVDETLFQRIGEGDREAFAELYHTTKRAVYTFILSIVRDPEETKDLVQEVYLKVRSAAHLYRPMGKPLAWMFTIARRLSLNYLRGRGRIADGEDDSTENRLDFSYIQDSTDKLVLKAALLILKPEERQAVLLHAVAGLRHHEIAKNMGVPLSTALSRYHRAIKKLKKHLTEQGVAV